MLSLIEKEIGLTLAEYHGMTQKQLSEKSKTLTEEQIRAFNNLTREDMNERVWKERNEGTYPLDVEMREFIINEIKNTSIENDWAVREGFGCLFEEYIVTYPVNVNGFIPKTTVSLGAYGGILNFVLLNKAIDEILEVAFDKFGFMLEWIQNFEYLTPTHRMIGSTMRQRMEEFNTK